MYAGGVSADRASSPPALGELSVVVPYNTDECFLLQLTQLNRLTTLCYQCFLDAARKKVHLPCKVSLTLGGYYSASCKDLCGCAVLCIWVGRALAPPR